MGSDRSSRVIERVIADIYARLGEPITIDDMAHSATYSKSQFVRIFKRAIGAPPGQFVTSARIQEAQRLLLTTSLSVTEIAERVGYSSLGSFGTKFKSTVGLSPTAFRDTADYTEAVSGTNRRKRP